MARNPAVSQQTDTLTQPIPMPRHTHLLRRGSRYYLNVKVPNDLREVFKREIIRKALNTSDPHEAVLRVRLEGLRVQADFENERAKLRRKSEAPRKLSEISTRDAYARVRIEVAFTFKKNGYRLEGGHTSEDWDNLPRMLEKLSARAARRVNWVFGHFNDQTQIVASGISADDLLQEIGVCSRDLATAKAIKQFLLQFSSIAASGTTERVSRACQCLGKNGVFEYRPDAGQGGNYVLIAPHRAALQEMQRRENL
jgi:hypothetical protein